MNKDMSLVAKRTILTYTYVLFTIFILKLCGLDYFGIDTSNPFIVFIDKLYGNFIVENLINFIFIMFYQHVMTSTIINSKSYKLTLLSAPFTFVFQFFLKRPLIEIGLGVFGDTLYLFILCFIYNKISKNNIKITKRFVIVILLNMLFQLVSYATRYRYSLDYIMSPSISVILSIDYTILMLMAYKIYFMKGDVKLWEFQDQACSSLQKLTSLRKQLKLFLTSYSKTNKKERFETTLFLILLFIWNMFTLFCIYIVAKLNNTVIECLFIVSSFWINKNSFGKPFHLKNALHCFIISNITYYCLNRITAPLEISIIIPLILGILLAWFTSKLVKDNKKPLYKGMSEKELKSKLDRIDASPIDYKICKLYYVDGYSEVKVANLTYYSVENIKKRKRNINDELKELIF